MKKSIEMSDPESCLNKAGEDEMIFVLRGKDPCFAPTVLYWAKLRTMAGIDSPVSEKITGAVVDAMTVQRDQFGEFIEKFAASAEEQRKTVGDRPASTSSDLLKRLANLLSNIHSKPECDSEVRKTCSDEPVRPEA